MSTKRFLTEEDEVRIKDELSASAGATEKQAAQIEQNTADISQLSKAVAVERARIDAFTSLPEGATTGDAELADAKIDKDGNTHTNVGEHIRTVTRQLSEDMEALKGNGTSVSGNGISDTARILLISILRNTLFKSDQSSSITALDLELKGSGSSDSGSGDDTGNDNTCDETTTYYSVVATGTNCTIESSATSIAEGGVYIATITLDNDYMIESVSVTMGGVNITNTAYSDGEIVISGVTGDIIITVIATSNNFVWVKGTTEDGGLWRTSAMRLTPFKKNGTFLSLTVSDNNASGTVNDDFRGNLYLATIPVGATTLYVPQSEKYIIAPAIFDVDGTRLYDPGYNTETIDLTSHPTAVYYGANMKNATSNYFSDDEWAEVEETITDFTFS